MSSKAFNKYVETESYQAQATAHAKELIFTSVITFFVSLYVVDAELGLVSKIAILFLWSLFGVSVLIALPTFLLKIYLLGRYVDKKKLDMPPNSSQENLLRIQMAGLRLLDAALVIASTFFVVTYFSQSLPSQTHNTFSCGDKLPQFTLGVQTQLTDRQLETLCTCVSNNLDSKAKETGIELATAEKTNRKFDDAGIQRIKEFSYAFGNAIKKCGGDKL